MNPRLDLSRAPRPAVLEALRNLLERAAVRSAHYLGYAHEPILRLLHDRLQNTFTVMDYWDRYGTEARFWYDPEDHPGPAPQSRRPAWLEGVEFYFEGLPPADLLIVDIPWQKDGLSRVLARSCGQAPRYVILADEAAASAGNPHYAWSHDPGYVVGILHDHPDVAKSVHD